MEIFGIADYKSQVKNKNNYKKSKWRIQYGQNEKSVLFMYKFYT